MLPDPYALQVDRLLDLEYPAKTDNGIKDLLAVLKLVPIAVAAKVVDEWTENNRMAPRPYDLRQMVEARKSTIANPSAGCGHCNGTGLLVERFLLTYGEMMQVVGAKRLGPNEFPDRGDNQTILTGAKDCVCRKQ